MTVDIVFADGSLGGTSRSAMTMGRVWRAAGHDVRFRPQQEPHPSRVAGFSEIGELMPVGSRAHLAAIVHLHHAAWSPEHREGVESLIELARLAPTAPRLLTHNIFGVRDRVLESWPGARTVGVLGAWSAEQYRWGMLGVADAPHPVVIPNPQDAAQFAPPDLATRARARARIGAEDGERVALRIGSPHPDKWSRHYVEAIRRNPGIRFLLIGAPADLVAAVRDLANVTTSEQTGDDDTIQDAYAAADVFAHIAERGESFGNVLVEALLTGLPVVSLARPYRDNTPWEFQQIPGFHYARSLRDWEQAVIAGPGRRDGVVDVDAAARRYGIHGVAAELSRLAEGHRSPDVPSRPSVLDRARVGVRHNPVAASLKEWHLRRRAL